ncbi:cation channel sperm-associated targeting subunit tau-like [Antedon mediterranea]|uniref:cation channel sperm-associated targeting subunit tau-like n=1 Tax=Antedon mediterranea TaxID=105859 RepID=UPI003AF495BD
MSAIHMQKIDDVGEDGFFNHDRAHYITAPPSGVLSVHMKKLQNINEQLIGAVDPELYIRFRVGNFIKTSGRYTSEDGTIVFDDTKHFSITVSRKMNDVLNEVRVDLVLVENSHTHRIVGHTDIHMFDIIKSLYLANTYDIRYKHQIVGKFEMELCFAYGIFGFGYSHQLENRQKKISDIVGHSLFVRVEPPEYRKQSKSNVITAIPMKHPEIIHFKEKADIGSFHLDQDPVISSVQLFNDADIVGESSLLHRMSKRRMNRLQNTFSQLHGRQQRKKFLEKLVLSHIDDHGAVDDQDIIPDKPGVGNRDGENSPGVVPGNLSSSEEDDENVYTLAPMLIMAPGLTTRGRGRGVADLPTVSEEERSNSADSTTRADEASSNKEPQDNQQAAEQGASGGGASTALARGLSRFISLRPWRKTATE